MANNIASWDGSSWSVLGTGLIGNSPSQQSCGGYSQYGVVTSMVVFNNELYVGGTFNNAGGITVKNIAKWDGSNWSDVLGGVGHYGVVNSLAVFNNELYVGGNFDTAGVLPVSNIAKWNGSSWSNVGSGIKGVHVRSMATLNTDLYVGGNFDTAGVLPVSNIAKWNGSSWSALGSGIPDGGFGNVFIGVYCLTTYNNKVYAGNNSAGISKWDGSNWQAVGGGLGNNGVTSGAYAGTVFGTDLIIGGWFLSAGLTQSTSYIAKWNDLTWNHVGAPITGAGSGFNGCVSALATYNGSLYAGGTFLAEQIGIGSSPLNRIARFTGTVGISENSNLVQINVFPNPSSGMLYLELPTELKANAISIYSSTGELVYTNRYSNQVDVSNFASGVYFLTIPTESGTLRKGFVVDHK